MADSDLDPGASTQMFRAFVDSEQDERGAAVEDGRGRLLAGALIGLVVGLIVAFLVFG
jgi:hypothetical protein